MPRAIASILCLLALTLSTACGSTPATPTAADLTPTSEAYTGTMSPGGAGFYSFTVSNSGTADITFGSLINAATGRALDVVMGVGIGTPAGDGCNVTTGVFSGPGLTTQLSHAVTPGSYCIAFTDIGNLRVTANFGVRIVHP